MSWLRNRRTKSLAELEQREVQTLTLLYTGRFDDAADELNDISAGYAKLGNYAAAARALARRVDPLLNALRMGELGADSFRLGDLAARIPARERDEFDDFREVASGKRDAGTPLSARTLLEAMTYLELSAPGTEIEHARFTSAARDGDVFLLRFHGGEGAPVRFVIAVRSLPDEGFGEGRSKIIDAGQWIMLATDWTRLAAAAPDEEGEQLRVRARDAHLQALAFVSPGRDRVADDGVWTTDGKRLRAVSPDMFRRAWLTSHIDSPER